MVAMDTAEFDSRSASLLDDGGYQLAASQRVIAQSQWLLDATRDLMLTFRTHRFRSMRGANDATADGDVTADGAHSDDVQDIASDVVAGPSLPRTTLPARPPRGTLGGLARAAKLTPEQRQEIARKAATVRWERFRSGVGTGPPEARLGGLARARALTPERRQEIARQASQAMWDRMKTTRRDPD